MIAMLRFFFLLDGFALHPVSRLAFSDSCTRANTAPSRSGRAGATPQYFSAVASRQKWGRSRPFWCFFSVSLFPPFSGVWISSLSLDLRTFQREECGEDEVAVGNSCLLHLLRLNSRRARTARSFLLGWSDPRFTLATQSCAKVGSLQPNTRCFARVQSDRRAMLNFLSFGHLRVPPRWTRG